MQKMLKNINYESVVDLADEVPFQAGQVVSKTLCQTPAVGITLFAMTKGEGISAHKSTGDAFVLALAGKGRITIEDTKYELCAGQSIVMPAGKPHAVDAAEDFKMLLVVVFPGL